MPTLQLVQVHTREQVEEIIQQAASIAWDQQSHIDVQIAVFNKAVDLLAARIPIVPQAPIPFDLDSLRGPRI